MLIYLDKSLVEKFQQQKHTESELLYLERIFYSHINSQHYVFFDRKSLEFFRNFTELSQTIRAYLNIIALKYTTIASYLNDIRFKIKVVDKSDYFKKNINNEKIDFNVSLDYFENPRVLESSKLITENMDDCNFYKEILSVYKKKPPKSLFGFDMDSNDGNGQGIIKSFNDKIERQNNIITIVDSDKKQMSDANGYTAQSMLRVYEMSKDTSITACHVLNVHEKENLVPFQIYHLKQRGNNTLRKLELISRDEKFYDFLYFFDYKEGVHTDNYLEIYKNILDIEGILEICGKDTDMFYGSQKEFIEYIKRRSQDKITYKKLYIIKPVGDNLLRDFNFNSLEQKAIERLEMVENLNQVPEYEKEKFRRIINICENFFEFLLPYQKESLEEICETLLCWGLCKPLNTE